MNNTILWLTLVNYFTLKKLSTIGREKFHSSPATSFPCGVFFKVRSPKRSGVQGILPPLHKLSRSRLWLLSQLNEKKGQKKTELAG